jgi:hypothetical protein
MNVRQMMAGAIRASRARREKAKRKATFCEQKVAKKLYLLRVMGCVGDNAHGPA